MTNVQNLDRRQLLADHWMLRCLSNQEFDQVLRFARVQLYPRNRIFFEQGEAGNALMAVLRGSAKASTPTRGAKEVILNIIGPREIFGEIALLDEGPRSATVTTLEDTSLLIIENRDFKPILDANPALCRALLWLVCGRLRRASDQVVETMFLERDSRLAKTLIWLAERYGSETADGIAIGVTLSQREHGNVAAMSRESVNKQLTEWSKTSSGLPRLDRNQWARYRSKQFNMWLRLNQDWFQTAQRKR